MAIKSPVENHYHREGLYNIILQQLREAGIDNVTRKDLTGVDEFHVRGAAVSLELAKEAGFDSNSKVLDIGCGLGGPARMIADEFKCHVTGIDITEEYIETARQLTSLVKLEEKINFLQADALHLPFADAGFDFVWTQHVQMNIQDKATLYAEATRVLKPGGKFIYYDILSVNNVPIIYPVPWADNDSISFLITTDELNRLLLNNGLRKISTKDQTPAAIQFFKGMFARIESGEDPNISLRLLIGTGTKEKFRNLYNNIVEGKLELQSGIYQK